MREAGNLGSYSDLDLDPRGHQRVLIWLYQTVGGGAQGACAVSELSNQGLSERASEGSEVFALRSLRSLVYFVFLLVCVFSVLDTEVMFLFF